MLKQPHVAALTSYAAKLRRRGDIEVPDVDPLDGGIDAEVLFLFEKPGPMTATGGKRTGSGFISRNNDDATAEATFQFMVEAGIPRKLTVAWNVVPWWNGIRKIASLELREGAACVEELIELLPNVRAVVFVGRKARNATKYLKVRGIELLTSDHPSPLVRARWPERWKAIPNEWAKVKRHIRRFKEPGRRLLPSHHDELDPAVLNAMGAMPASSAGMMKREKFPLSS